MWYEGIGGNKGLFLKIKKKKKCILLDRIIMVYKQVGLNPCWAWFYENVSV